MGTPDPKVTKEMQTLTSAFEQFSKETERLEKAYSALEMKFVAVSEKLEETDLLLKNKVAELDMVSEHLQSILSHINEGILFVGQNGMITTYNKAAEQILGRTQHQTLLHNYWMEFADDFFGFSLKSALEKKEAPPLVHVTLGETEVDISVSLVSKGPKTNQGVILVLRDVSEMRKLQMRTELHDRMKELGEMAAFVAHEIRNPLGGILGFASLLKRELVGKEESLAKVETIIEGTERLNLLVEEVLHYARPLTLRFKRCNINHLIKKVGALLKADSATDPNHTLLTSMPKVAIYLEIDEGLIHGALLNLSLNALQAMPQGGTLRYMLKHNIDGVHIIVSDTGCGIEKKNLVKIFSPFFTTKEQGSGLGLSEAYKIMQAHGGKIEVTSELGAGTTFTLSFPDRRKTCA